MSEEVGLHQRVLLLQRQAHLSLLAQLRVELQQVSPLRLHVLLQVRLLAMLRFDLSCRVTSISGWIVACARALNLLVRVIPELDDDLPDLEPLFRNFLLYFEEKRRGKR